MLRRNLDDFFFVMALYHKATFWIAFNFFQLRFHDFYLLSSEIGFIASSMYKLNLRFILKANL